MSPDNNYVYRPQFHKLKAVIPNIINLIQKYSLIKIFYTSLIGLYLHIFLDSINVEPMLEIYSSVFILGLFLLLMRIMRFSFPFQHKKEGQAMTLRLALSYANSHTWTLHLKD